jgi:hypothetical protein
MVIATHGGKAERQGSGEVSRGSPGGRLGLWWTAPLAAVYARPSPSGCATSRARSKVNAVGLVEMALTRISEDASSPRRGTQGGDGLELMVC